MALITVSVAGGASNTNGAYVGGVQPTAADDLLLTVASGNFVITGTLACRSMDCNTYTGTVSGSGALNIGDGTAGANSIALRVVSGQGWTATSAISFVSTSATVQSITTAGKSLGAVNFNGVAGSWQNADNMTSTGTITGTNGTWDWNGKTISCTTCVRSGSAAFTLTPGAGSLTCTAGATSWSWGTATNLTVTANTATVTQTGAAAVFASGTFNWNGLSVVQSGSGIAQLTGAATIANYTRTATAVKTDSVTFNANPVITSTVTFNGNSVTNRLYVASNTEGTQRTITAAVVVLNNCGFRDIVGAGAGTWSGTSVADCLHNSGITFTPAVTRYRVGAGGTWSDTGWSTSSGGSSGASVPLAQDTVFVDSGASGTITMDMPRLGADVSFAGFTGTASFSSLATTMYGSLTWGSGMTVSGTQTLSLAARSAKTITSNGKAFTMTVSLLNSANTYSLGDDFSGTIIAFNGASCTLTATTQNVTLSTALQMNNVSVCTTNMGSGTWTLSGTGNVLTRTAAGQIVNAQTSTLAITDTSATAKTLQTGTVALTLNIVTITAGGTGVVTFGNGISTWTIATLNLTGGAKNLRVFAGATLSIGSAAGWNVSGTSGNLVTIDTTTAGTAFNLTVASGIVSSDYLSLKDSHAAGGALFYAGDHSTNVSGNTGWVFTRPPVTLAGTTAGSSSSAGTMVVAHGLAGTTSSVAATSLTIKVAHHLAGASAGSSSSSGALRVTHALSGATAATFSSAATAVVAHGLSGVTGSASLSTGALGPVRGLAGITGSTSSASLALGLLHTLQGTTTGASSATGNVRVLHGLAGTTGGDSTSALSLRMFYGLIGVTGGQSSSTAHLRAHWALRGVTAGGSSARATLRDVFPGFRQPTGTRVVPSITSTKEPRP